MTENIGVIIDWFSLEFYFKIQLVTYSKQTAVVLWKPFSRQRIDVCVWDPYKRLGGQNVYFLYMNCGGICNQWALQGLFITKKFLEFLTSRWCVSHMNKQTGTSQKTKICLLDN
jgi:hypothetical protein